MGRVLSELRIDDPRDVVGMTRKKGGGRESGRPDPGGADSTPQGSHEPEAAADPAACSLCGEIHLNPYLRTHAERIRALEAELVFLGRHNFECPAQALLEKAEDRVKEHEAHVNSHDDVCCRTFFVELRGEDRG